ncbi:MAG: septal ring lytic transglycosylase RlpA family protein [Spirochaetaceae bacterium]|jgi:rare lipoprotein A|nr:septal ring lytic transglycosylase RlpA family protein [Spirochaetaceae bacterium]
MKNISVFFISGLFAVTLCAAQTQTPGSAFRQEGIASWYGIEFEGRPTASGELFDPSQFTAAHPDLPFDTMLIVTNAVNGEKVMVRVNDRGPFVKSRIIDVSKAAAEKLNMLETGTAQVIIELAPRNATTATVDAGAALPASESYAAGPAVQAQTEVEAAPAVSPAQASQQQHPATAAAPPPYTPQQPSVVQSPPVPPATRDTAAAVPQTTRDTAAAVPQTTRDTAAAVPQTTRQTAAAVPQTVRQTAPQAGRPPVPPPAASFQPIPTTARPPVSSPSASSAPPSRPASGSAPTAAAVPPARSHPSYASADIIGGPVVNGRYYRLQIGSYKVAKNAVEVFDRLSAAGLNPQWEPFGNLYRIVLSNVRAEEVNSTAARLGSAGFKEVIVREER